MISQLMTCDFNYQVHSADVGHAEIHNKSFQFDPTKGRLGNVPYFRHDG